MATDCKKVEEEGKTLSPSEEYMKNLKIWKHNYNMYIWSTYFQQVVSYNNQLFKQRLPNLSQQPNNPSLQSSSNQQPATYSQTFTLPSLTRRVVAEFIDAIVLMIFKVAILWILKTSTELINSDMAYNFLIGDYIFHDGDMFSEDDFLLMLISAFLNRILSCFYEYYFIKQYGYTIGKRLLSLKVVQCSLITRNQEGDVYFYTVHPGGRVSTNSSWLRASFKNLSIAFLIPSSFTALFNSDKRTSYDVFSKTIVVRTRNT